MDKKKVIKDLILARNIDKYLISRSFDFVRLSIVGLPCIYLEVISNRPILKVSD